MKKTLIALGILVVVVIAIWAMFRRTDEPVGPTAPITATTTTGGDTGTTVTPPATTTPEKESDTAALNQRIYKFGVHITPLEVVGDSRCPTDVQCIQAGDVKLKAKLEDATHSEIVTFVTGSPVSFGNKHVALMSVMPAKNSKVTIKPSDYRFTFSVAYGMGGDAP